MAVEPGEEQAADDQWRPGGWFILALIPAIPAALGFGWVGAMLNTPALRENIWVKAPLVALGSIALLWAAARLIRRAPAPLSAPRTILRAAPKWWVAIGQAFFGPLLCVASWVAWSGGHYATGVIWGLFGIMATMTGFLVTRRVAREGGPIWPVKDEWWDVASIIFLSLLLNSSQIPTARLPAALMIAGAAAVLSALTMIIGRRMAKEAP